MGENRSVYQLCIACVIKDKVFWFEIAIDDAFIMQVDKRLDHTRCVEPRHHVVKHASVIDTIIDRVQ